ncbi:hypothetical protein WME89_50470 [Sorangium sp. So ce321]|uniref:DUF6896 domain-containing protein n=1 Tax=Sorangium sp. So ce321 TaxID=3133300 RepID=UPI003F5DFABE
MTRSDALQLLEQFASLQGRLVRNFLELYAPKDREGYRDAPKGTLSTDGRTWKCQRHGAGVVFVDLGGVRVNAHVGMAEYPEGMDGGRLFEYLDSLGLSVVIFGDREYDVTKFEMDQMIDDMVQGGLLRAITTKGRFPYRIFELVRSSSDPSDGGKSLDLG